MRLDSIGLDVAEYLFNILRKIDELPKIEQILLDLDPNNNFSILPNPYRNHDYYHSHKVIMLAVCYIRHVDIEKFQFYNDK